MKEFTTTFPTSYSTKPIARPHFKQLLRNYDVGYVRKTRDGRMTVDQMEAVYRLKCHDTTTLLWKAAVAVAHNGNLPLGELR